jgi:hypothetical protein
MADPINKSEPFKAVYKDGKIKIVGNKVKAVIEIASGELSKMYWGKEGTGTIHLEIEQD